MSKGGPPGAAEGPLRRGVPAGRLQGTSQEVTDRKRTREPLTDPHSPSGIHPGHGDTAVSVPTVGVGIIVIGANIYISLILCRALCINVLTDLHNNP